MYIRPYQWIATGPRRNAMGSMSLNQTMWTEAAGESAIMPARAPGRSPAGQGGEDGGLLGDERVDSRTQRRDPGLRRDVAPRHVGLERDGIAPAAVDRAAQRGFGRLCVAVEQRRHG